MLTSVDVEVETDTASSMILTGLPFAKYPAFFLKGLSVSSFVLKLVIKLHLSFNSFIESLKSMALFSVEAAAVELENVRAVVVDVGNEGVVVDSDVDKVVTGVVLVTLLAGKYNS